MKTIIAGSRGITNYGKVRTAIAASGFDITEVVCGDARGVDLLGARWAEENSIPCRHFPADWTTFGKRAGYLRNQEMAEYADALIAVWDGKSRGTAHMLMAAKKYGLMTYIHPIVTRTYGRD